MFEDPREHFMYIFEISCYYLSITNFIFEITLY